MAPLTPTSTVSAMWYGAIHSTVLPSTRRPAISIVPTLHSTAWAVSKSPEMVMTPPARAGSSKGSTDRTVHTSNSGSSIDITDSTSIGTGSDISSIISGSLANVSGLP